MINLEKLVRDNIKRLSPYSTARDEYSGDIGIYLDANESPYDNGINRYPDPYQRELKSVIARLKGIKSENLFIGNGSDEPIDLLYRIFCEPRRDNVVMIAPTYGMYRVAAAINDVEIREVALRSDFSLDASAVLTACDSSTKIVFLCSPNNPTGNTLDRGEIMRIVENFEGIVVIDEAYIDFSSHSSFSELISQHANIVVLQTMSKAWGMAGVRLGLAIANSRVIEILTKVKYPYNISTIVQKCVLEALNESITDQVREVVSQREILYKALFTMPQVKQVFVSDANFLLVRVDNPITIYNRLLEQRIIVRNRSSVPGCEGCLRITVGTPAENERVIETLLSL